MNIALPLRTPKAPHCFCGAFGVIWLGDRLSPVRQGIVSQDLFVIHVTLEVLIQGWRRDSVFGTGKFFRLCDLISEVI